MTQDPNKRSLWGAGHRSDDTDHRWMQPGPAAPQQAPPPRAPEPQRRKRRTGLGMLAAALAVVVVALASVVAGQKLGHNKVKTATVSLPVVTGSTPATRAGQIYRQVQHGVVQIRTSDASGTGFVIDGQGIIVTNAHVVDNASTVRVIFDDGKASVQGTVLGRDVSADLAAIKIDPSQVDGKLTVLALADSDKVQTGDEVIAIGYPLGLDRTATEGIVSGLGRQIQAQNGFSIDKVIQTDASINPGNSGGPLLDADGRVIGVNSQIAATAAGSNTGIGFAIPSNEVRTTIPALVAGKTIEHPYIGVSLEQSTNDDGAIVAQVVAGGPGDNAGLSASGSGDKITAIDGTPVADPDALITALDAKSVGDKVDLTIDRDGATKHITVTLGARPANATTSSSTVSPTSPSGSQIP